MTSELIEKLRAVFSEELSDERQVVFYLIEDAQAY